MEERKPFKHPKYNWIPEGKYTVSQDGRVFINDTVQCTYHRDRSGIHFIRVSGDCRDSSLTRAFMVLVAYKGLPPPKHKARHIDGNPENDHIDNLEWCTEKELSKIRMQNPVNYKRVSEMGKSHTRLSAEEIQNVINWFKAGLKPVEICEHLNHKVKPISLYNLKYKYGLHLPKKKEKKEEQAPKKTKSKRKYTKRITNLPQRNS